MHIEFRDSPGLGLVQPIDLNQTPADLVVLSFSDSDLGSFSTGWHQSERGLPSLRLANISALIHPLSVDEYAEKTLRHAKIILVRLIGGESYWSYGLSILRELHQQYGVALAILPADGRDDARLDELSTLPPSTLSRLRTLCEAGGPAAAEAALFQMALSVGLRVRSSPILPESEPAEPAFPEAVTPDLSAAGGPAHQKASSSSDRPASFADEVPSMGIYDLSGEVLLSLPSGKRPEVWVVFYRSYLSSADTAPINLLIEQLRHAGFSAYGIFVPSLKVGSVRAWLRDLSSGRNVVAVVNATAFSAKSPEGDTPFDTLGCPVFQVALSTAQAHQWAVSERGLSPADLAMHVALPEVDGRIFAGVVSFKSPEVEDPKLEYARYVHTPHPERLDAVVSRVVAWHRLQTTEPAEQQLGIILSTYPGKSYQMAHAVGLDGITSTQRLLAHLAEQGYQLPEVPDTSGLTQGLSSQTLSFSREAYRAAMIQVSPSLKSELWSTWGEPEQDPNYRNGAFHFSGLRLGSVWVALQPERGTLDQREAEYHDTSRAPCHSYVAFYLWLQSLGIHAMVHMGAHGTLEWLPGKAVALSSDCWPDLLCGSLPIIYPFIVNDPGEAAQAKRRLSAVTVGHMAPPILSGAIPEELLELERLLDEFSTADGLDLARRDRLIHEIRLEAQATGVEADLNLAEDAPPSEALVRIDRFVCDIKDSQYGDGLHILGEGEWAKHELSGLLTALRGGHLRPGPSGSPHRGRTDVLPPGRNLYSVDPRAVPTPNAYAQGVKMAEELCRRHLQDEGDYLTRLVVDLWGSATMRTAGEDYAMALCLAGLSPVWDEKSGRVIDVKIIESQHLNRPRVDVTLRVSGLFRDIFSGLAQLFEKGAEKLSKQSEPASINPYLDRCARVFAPKPGEYGVSIGGLLDTYSEAEREAAGEAWIKASSWSFDVHGVLRPNRGHLEAQLVKAEAFVHAHDLPEADLLLAADFAAHEGGFAAAVNRLGQDAPSLYHLDNTRPEVPKARTLKEEVARVVRGRVSDPRWTLGMMQHGYRGAAEIAATLDHLAAFAHLARVVEPHLFDSYHDATLGREEVVAFMQKHNPEALTSVQTTFQKVAKAGLWQTLRNDIAASMHDGAES